MFQASDWFSTTTAGSELVLENLWDCDGTGCARTACVSERTCPSCGETKSEDDYWSGARRCRSCVAIETGARRTDRARQERERIQQEYGLAVSLSGRRFQQVQTEAADLANQAVARQGRDKLAEIASRLATAFGWAVPIDLFVGKAAFGEDGMFVVAGGLFVCWGATRYTSTVLAAPRNKIVARTTRVFLRSFLHHAEAEQLEYSRFYQTPDWRNLRELVIERDGPVCRGCARSIDDARDLTVDHIRPRSRFPSLALEADNLQVLCRSCNSAKGATC